VNAKSLAFSIFVTGAAVAIAFAPLPLGSRLGPTTRAFHVEARQFAYTPSELQVNPGDTVTIELVSTDVVHGLYVDGYGLSVIADPGQTAAVTFVATKPGSFRLRCNVTCGAMHPFIIGRLRVGTNAWLYRSVGLAALAVGMVLLGRPRASRVELTP
jgi:cytochrome c oxidase subunit II